MLAWSPTASVAVDGDPICFLRASHPGRQGPAGLGRAAFAGPQAVLPWAGVRASGHPDLSSGPSSAARLCGLCCAARSHSTCPSPLLTCNQDPSWEGSRCQSGLGERPGLLPRQVQALWLFLQALLRVSWGLLGPALLPPCSPHSARLSRLQCPSQLPALVILTWDEQKERLLPSLRCDHNGATMMAFV